MLLLPVLVLFTGCFTGDMLQSIAEQSALTEMIEAYMQKRGISGEIRDATMIADRPAQDYSGMRNYLWVT